MNPTEADGQRGNARQGWTKARLEEAVVKAGHWPPAGLGLDDGVPRGPTVIVRTEPPFGGSCLPFRLGQDGRQAFPAGRGQTSEDKLLTGLVRQESSSAPMWAAAFWSSLEMASV
jgi:hypothetical protein